jgi:hypothetical protein
VRDCLSRILQSPAFKASTRPKQFLTFVVEEVLDGRQDEIKERTIGTAVFGRTADFETSGDSIVRVNANEVRKRLTHYYRDLEKDDPVRITLPQGSYVPEFVFVDATPAVEAPGATPAVEPAPAARARWSRPLIGAVLAAGLFLLAIAAFPLFRPRPALERFWSPVLSMEATPILSLPSTNTLQVRTQKMPGLKPFENGAVPKLDPSDLVAFHDWHTSLPVLQATIAVTAALQRMGKTPVVRIGDDLKMDEVRGHPIIAIGSFSNSWTQHNVSGLRFTFERGAAFESPSIRDARDPNRRWSLARTFPDAQDKDYSIVTRTFDPATREPFVSLAGLHSFGCQIAGEFVSGGSFWKDLETRAPRGWEKMNLQVVLETQVIRATTTTPRIADIYFWR